MTRSYAKSPWTAERERLLVELARLGKSCAEIAREIGARTVGPKTTKNSVIGKARRMGLDLNDPAKFANESKREPRRASERAERRKPGRLLLRLGWLDGAFD